MLYVIGALLGLIAGALCGYRVALAANTSIDTAWMYIDLGALVGVVIGCWMAFKRRCRAH